MSRLSINHNRGIVYFHLIFFLILTVVLSAQVEKSKGYTDKKGVNHLLTSKGVDGFYLMQKIPLSNDRYQVVQSTIEIEEFVEPIYYVYEEGVHLLSIRPTYDRETMEFTDKIKDIIVLTDRYATADGISVGTTLRTYRQQHPSEQLKFSYISNRFWVGGRMQFVFNPKGYLGLREALYERDMVMIPPSSFDEHTKIESIRIY